jgi:hypothetical protein
MAEIVGAYFTSHVPAIGGAIHKGLQQEPIGSRSSTVIKGPRMAGTGKA